MKTKIVYVVTSDCEDSYLEQTFLSILSLRKYNPDCHVSFVTDTISNQSIINTRKIIESVIDEKIIVNIEGKTKHQRSRILKTSLRKYIQGDYLFIDSDTIICDSLESVDNFDGDICAVVDKHFDFQEHKMHSELEEWGKKVGWDLSQSPYYFNSGVMYVKDNSKTHEFYDIWNKVWIEGTNKGIGLDQPSLAKTNQIFNNIISEIPGIWNCQILENGLSYLSDAKIIHYFASNLGRGNRTYAYAFANKNLYKDILIKYPQIKEITDLLNHPKGAFSKESMIVNGDEIDIIKSTSFSCLRRLYSGYPKIFKYIELVVRKTFRIK